MSQQDKHQHSGNKHGHNDPNAHMNERPFEDLVAGFESPERDAWQKPDQVIDMLGDLEGKTVMDIGSGTGYFSFRLAEAGANVICADVDKRFLEFIRQRKAEKGLDDSRLQTRKIPYDSPSLEKSEVDMVLIVNTYHHIEDRPAYFSQVREGLKPGGQLVVIDFFRKETPVGPPVEMKLTSDTVQAELATAGFGTFEVDRNLLPYQYIVMARE